MKSYDRFLGRIEIGFSLSVKIFRLLWREKIRVNNRVRKRRGEGIFGINSSGEIGLAR